MSGHTAISWCDSTFNPWIGCTKVSPACDHCYAARQDAFRKWTPEGWGGPRRRTSAALWKEPAKWNKEPFFECLHCQWRGPDNATLTIDNPPGFHPPVAWMRGCPACRKPTLKEARRRVFCASLADVFDNQVPPEWRSDLFALIYATPHLDWLLLTKRIGNVASMLVGPGMPGRMPSHARLGITVCNQPEADRDIVKLLALDYPNFLSIEPMLGPVDLAAVRAPFDALPGADLPVMANLDWVICGGESGPHARPMHPDWVRSLRDQCAAAGVPFHFKQWGEWREQDDSGLPGVRHVVEGDPEFDSEADKCDAFMALDGHLVANIDDAPLGVRYRGLERPGTKAAGRLLDGIEHNGFPS